MHIPHITQMLAHARLAAGDELPPGLVFDEELGKFVADPNLTPPKAAS